MHDQILSEYPQEMLDDHYRLSALVVELVDRYKEELTIQVIDPQSLLGIFKSLRYWVRKYPTFIIDGREIIVGWNRAALERALEASKVLQAKE